MSKKPQQTYYVILCPPDPDTPDRARQIARIMQRDEEQVRQTLQSPTYQVLARYAKKPNAEGFQSQLYALGYNSLVVSDNDIKSHLFMWAMTANKGQGGMAVVDYSEQPLFTPFDDILIVVAGVVKRADESETLMIDLVRKSTPITPRLDTDLFDFEEMLGKEGADAYALLEELKSGTSLELDLSFNEIQEALVPAVAKGLASHPGMFAPPLDKIGTQYDSTSLKLFNVYSFFTREQVTMELQKK